MLVVRIFLEENISSVRQVQVQGTQKCLWKYPTFVREEGTKLKKTEFETLKR